MFTKNENKPNYYEKANRLGMIFPELRSYFNKMNEEKSQCSVRGYEESISRFLIHFNVFSIADMEKITKNELINFQSSLRDSGLKFTSVNTHIQRIKAFWGDLIYRELIKNESITKIKALKKSVKDDESKEIFILMDNEINAMIENTKDIQEKMMLVFMNEFALRRDEVTKILLSDIQKDVNGTVHLLVKGKGNKNVKLAMKPEVLNIFNVAINNRKSDSQYLFYGKGHKGKLTGQAVFDRVIKAARNAEILEERINKIGAHTLRRTTISRWAKKYGILIARDMARHNDVITTERYAKTTQQDIDKAFLSE